MPPRNFPNPKESVMEIQTQFPHPVKEINHFYIPLADGTRLAGRMWLPEDAEDNPVPAILEALPYRKRDGTLVRDEITHPWMAGQGYACIRVDLRGCGDSHGIFEDEYVPQEQADIIEVIHWIAAQNWCTGKVGMMGISWGGFNSLQVAYENPEPLKAVISLCSTHDRFNDDIHYKGGCLLLENVGWSGYMFNLLAMPPDPALDPQWRQQWAQRIQALEPGGISWLSHQTRDAFWRHGSVCEDYSRIRAAVMVVTGWADAYVNNVPELLEHLDSPCRAIVGPWVHKYPHFAKPDPQVGFLQEALKWWDRWLKDKENGVEDQPRANHYIMEPYLSRDFYKPRKGQWICDERWPSPHVTEQRLFLTPERGMAEAPSQGNLTIASPLTCGSAGGEYGLWMLGPEYPLDQRHDDADSLCFDFTAPEDLNITGRARVKLKVKSDKACGQICVRLNHVQPTGDDTRISYGLLNLSLRENQATPSPVEPGQWYEVTVPIDHIAYRVPAGETLRLSISSAYFPLVWPSPEFCTLGLDLAGCCLDLPLHDRATAQAESPFPPAVGAAGAGLKEVEPVRYKRTITTDAATGKVTTRIIDDLGTTHYTDMGDYKIGQVCEEIYSVKPHDPLSARAVIRWHHTMERDGRVLDFDSEIKFSGDRENFRFQAFQRIRENDEETSHRTWDESIPRITV